VIRIFCQAEEQRQSPEHFSNKEKGQSSEKLSEKQEAQIQEFSAIERIIIL
jgi:hypothetical protein